MKRLGLLLCVLLISFTFLTGCWNRKELNQLAIAVGIGIDKSEDQYKVSIQVVEPSEIAGKSGGGGVAPVTLYQATAHTVLEAIRKITVVSPRIIYPAHLRILVLGESLAREGIGGALELFSRDPQVRNDFFIVVAKQSNAEDTLRILTNLEKIPSVRLFSTLATSEKEWAPTKTVKLAKLISDLVSEGKHPVLTGLKLTGDVKIGETKKNVETVLSPADLSYSGLGVFKKDKLIGWLSDAESKGYNYITNNIKKTIGYLKFPEGGTVSLKVIRSRTKTKGSIRDGQPMIDITVYTEVNIGEVQSDLDLNKTETIAELEEMANRKSKEFIEHTIKSVQEKYKIDIFGFGEVIHRSDPKAWKELKKDWDQTFTSLPVHVKVITKIRRLGKVSNSFLQEMK